MIVFPAIDLKGGEVVRLAEGDMNRATVYADDPAAQAMLFAEQGAQFLHVVDLDGAFAGRPENAEAVEGIIENFPGYIQLGGGIRNAQTVERWFDMGVARLVIGTALSLPSTRAMDLSRLRAGPRHPTCPSSIWPAGLRMRAWRRSCSPTLAATGC
jgi:phosphoribosylformimino-5-aminoimidazole carboxamide ribotide isomerase